MENEVRLIDANALIEKLREAEARKGLGAAIAGLLIRYIGKMPTIDPESLRPKGRWIGEGDGYADGEIVYDVWHCSECDYCIDDGTDDPELLPNYCPNCGADMRKQGE